MSPLIDGIAFDGLIADKAFDSNALVAELNDRGARVVISQHPARAQKLKELKRIAMRACKTDRSFSAMIYLAAAVINSR